VTARKCSSVRASVDEDVHATADREVGFTPLKASLP